MYTVQYTVHRVHYTTAYHHAIHSKVYKLSVQSSLCGRGKQHSHLHILLSYQIIGDSKFSLYKRDGSFSSSSIFTNKGTPPAAPSDLKQPQLHCSPSSRAIFRLFSPGGPRFSMSGDHHVTEQWFQNSNCSPSSRAIFWLFSPGIPLGLDVSTYTVIEQPGQ